jgi:hypothetical protein
MTHIEDESAVIAATLRRGHQLLAAYLVAAYVIVVVGVWFYRSAWASPCCGTCMSATGERVPPSVSGAPTC